MKLIEKLYYKGFEFSVSQKSYRKIEIKNGISINVFGYQNEQVHPNYLLENKFKNLMEFLLLRNRGNSHCVCIKGFNRFIYNKNQT